MIDSLAFYIAVLRKQFIAYCTRRLSEMDVTYVQLLIIIFVGKKERCSPKEITVALGMDAGQLNRLLSKMAENDLLMQKKNEKDKRANIITLTSKGKQVFQESYALFQQWDESIAAPLTEEEKEQLKNLMKKITLYTEKISRNGG